jgi:hypothetical protein
MAKRAPEVRRADATAGTDPVYRSLFRRLTGGGRVGFNNAVYMSERQTADRNEFAFTIGLPANAEANGHTEIAALLREHAQPVLPLSHHSGRREAAAV